MLMENKFYNHHVIKHETIVWDTTGLLDLKITSSRMSLKGRTGSGERGTSTGKEKMKNGHKISLNS